MTRLQQIEDVTATWPAIFQEGGLSFTRLGREGGVLHTGGSGGLVYSASVIANLMTVEENDDRVNVITTAPTYVTWLLRALSLACERIAEGEWETADTVAERYLQLASPPGRNAEGQADG